MEKNEEKLFDSPKQVVVICSAKHRLRRIVNPDYRSLFFANITASARTTKLFISKVLFVLKKEKGRGMFENNISNIPLPPKKLLAI